MRFFYTFYGLRIWLDLIGYTDLVAIVLRLIFLVESMLFSFEFILAKVIFFLSAPWSGEICWWPCYETVYCFTGSCFYWFFIYFDDYSAALLALTYLLIYSKNESSFLSRSASFLGCSNFEELKLGKGGGLFDFLVGSGSNIISYLENQFL